MLECIAWCELNRKVCGDMDPRRKRVVVAMVTPTYKDREKTDKRTKQRMTKRHKGHGAGSHGDWLTWAG